jgi:hypothetical protein
MRKRIAHIRLLISLCVPVSLLLPQAASPDEWHSATGGGASLLRTVLTHIGWIVSRPR